MFKIQEDFQFIFRRIKNPAKLYRGIFAILFSSVLVAFVPYI